MVKTAHFTSTIISILVISVVKICLASPVDKEQKISIPEVYIPVPVRIQADDVDAQQQQPATTLSALSDLGATETVAPVVVRDESGNPETTQAPSSQSAEFPTPLPFLDEPEEASKSVDETVPSRGTLIPPNFDLNKIPGVTGSKREGDEHTPVYVGRQACKCGVSGERRFLSSKFNDTKIVNGEPAPIEEYPWTAALLRRNWLGFVSDRPYCGGTLINNLYILTASHCVDGMSPRGIVVALHEEDINSNSETPAGSTRYEVERIITHQNYNRRTIDNDIALLKLASPVVLDNVLIPACLPANNDLDFENFTATAAGWGAVKESGSTSNILRKVEVPVISNEDCNTKTKYKGKITDNMLCAGYVEEGGKDSCQGDSGGPLTVENGDRLTLIGIVSWGYGCARPNSPGVYTRVARYPEWIVENSKGAEWCLE